MKAVHIDCEGCMANHTAQHARNLIKTVRKNHGTSDFHVTKRRLSVCLSGKIQRTCTVFRMLCNHGVALFRVLSKLGISCM